MGAIVRIVGGHAILAGFVLAQWGVVSQSSRLPEMGFFLLERIAR